MKKIYHVIYENEIEGDREEWFYINKENAEKQYRKICKKHGLTPSFCYTNKHGICVMYCDEELLDAEA